MPKSENFTIGLSYTCDQKWDSLPHRANGLFCGECAKVVTDFSIMSDQQIIDYFKLHEPQKTCGKFHKGQLHRPLVPTREVKQKPLRSLILFLTGLLSLRNPGELRSQTTPQVVDSKFDASGKRNSTDSVPGKMLTGRVNSRYGPVSAKVIVTCDTLPVGSTFTTTADENGNYKVWLPYKVLNSTFTVVFYAEAYSSHSVRSGQVNPFRADTIVINAELHPIPAMREIYMTGGVPMQQLILQPSAANIYTYCVIPVPVKVPFKPKMPLRRHMKKR